LLGQTIDGRYLVVARLARGGMATVYQATDLRLDRPVAVKVLHAHLAEGRGFIDRFRREARSVARLAHPGIVAIYDQGSWGEAPYLVMELVDGPNLRTIMESSGLPPVGQALDLMAEALAALAAAHADGLVHRDVKPENILITAKGQVKVADFGLARTVAEVTAVSSGIVLGTVAYLAPELVADGAADQRADVYAAGVVLFELLTGAQPYTGDQPIQVAFQHVHAPFPAPSSRVKWLPQEIDSLVAALTAKAPERRPADAAAALSLVRAVRAALPGEVAARAALVAVRPADAAQAAQPAAAPAGAPGGQPGGDGGAGAPAGVGVGGIGQAGGGGGGDATERVPQAGRGTGGTHALPLASIPPAGPAKSPAAGPRPRRRRRLVWALVAALVLAAGAGGAWWYFERGPGSLVALPELSGQTRQAAEAKLGELGLVGSVELEHSDSAPAGQVIRTDPPAMARLGEGGIVRLVVSQGVRMATVPAAGVVGAAVEEAEAALAAAGLDGEVERQLEYATATPAGLVIAVKPAGGEQVAHNQAIALVVSQGPEPVTAPSLTGLTLDQAQAAAAPWDLSLVEAEAEYSETVPEGQVIAQDPVAGGPTHRGEQISVVVSLGMPFVDVPAVSGLSWAEAEAKLADLGLEAKRENQLAGIWGLVYNTDPPEGTPVRKGSTITVFVV
jgi:serine/threonine-protein kinase